MCDMIAFWLCPARPLLFSIVLIHQASRSLGAAEAAHHGSSNATDECSLWMSRSTIMPWTLGLFAGKDFSEGEIIGEHDGGIHIPLFDAKANERNKKVFRSGFDVSDDLHLESSFRIQSFLPGIGSMYVCVEDTKHSRPINNVLLDRKSVKDSAGVHRSTDPSAGSFSYRHGQHFRTSQTVVKGQEIFLSSCPSGEGELRRQYVKSNKATTTLTPSKSILWNDPYAICVDVFHVKRSNIAPGWGAFAKRSFQEGQTVISSPVAILHRSQLEILEQYLSDDGEVRFRESIKHWQLLLNYAYGHPHSSLLLLPYGPGGVHFINHGKEPNVVLRWSTSELSDNSPLAMNVLKASYMDETQLLVDYVALRDIDADEEIVMEYGPEWEAAWNRYMEKWQPTTWEGQYVSVADYQRKERKEDLRLVRTLTEQEKKPYPSNIRTACMYQALQDEDGDMGFRVWGKENEGCLRPCEVLERNESGNSVFYKVSVQQIDNKFVPSECTLPMEREVVHFVPEESIYLVDKEYTSDEHRLGSFRHEIHVPDGLYPELWKNDFHREFVSTGDFRPLSSEPGGIEHVSWSHGHVVTPNAYQMHLPQNLRRELLSYANRMGITERLHEFVVLGNQLPPGEERKIDLHGMSFWVQRTSDFWKSSMHWISPAEEASHENYLHALSAAGFDEVLSQIGNRFGFDGLCAFHLTFIGVSHCCPEGGYIHKDVSESALRANETRAFNVIIPLILQNETSPELTLLSQEEDEGPNTMGQYRYQYDVAVLLGDDAFHATSAVDYRESRQMRLAATVYVADVREDNVNEIMAHYTQKYPPKDKNHLLNLAGVHWNSRDPSVRLPKPNSTFYALQAIDWLKNAVSG